MTVDTWTCTACGDVHPADHAGIFCGTCREMVLCAGCERRGHTCPTDDDFDPVEFIRVARSQDEAWAALAPKVERVKDQAASPLAYTSPLRVTLGSHVRISPAARAAFGLKP